MQFITLSHCLIPMGPLLSCSPDACELAACLLMLLSVLVIILPAPGVTDMVTLESVIRCLQQTDMTCRDINRYKPQLFDYQAKSLCAMSCFIRVQFQGRDTTMITKKIHQVTFHKVSTYEYE